MMTAVVRTVLAKVLGFIFNPFTDIYIRKKWGGYWKMLLNHPQFKGHFLLRSCWIRHWEKMNSEIPIMLKIKGIPCFPHGERGVFISKNSTIGRNCVIFQQVTIGSNTLRGSNTGSPTIGDNCYIGAGAKIIGNVRVGNNCRIGANACVYKDMPDNSVAVCAPTRIIVKDSVLDNGFCTPDGEAFDFEKGDWVPVNESSHKTL